jgi:hypothetical protein
LDQLVDALRGKMDFIGADWVTESGDADKKKRVKLMDYACGTGVVSRVIPSFPCSDLPNKPD